MPQGISEFPELGLETFLELNAIPPGQTAHAALRVTGLDDVDATEWKWFPLADDYLYLGATFHAEDDGALLLGVPLEIDPEGETIVTLGSKEGLANLAPNRRA